MAVTWEHFIYLENDVNLEQCKRILANLDVLEAFVEGKPIQVKANGEWCESLTPSFDWAGIEYRIKPEPRKVWIWEQVNGGVRHAYDEKQHTLALTNCSNAGTTKYWKVYGPFELED